MDGWPQEISEHNDQSLMNRQNINDGARLRGLLSVDAFPVRSHTSMRARVCARDTGKIRRFVFPVARIFHAASSETESAIKCLKAGLNPNRSCLALS